MAIGGLDPESKLAIVAKAMKESNVVMVGDGAADAAALAQANVGIAVGTSAEVSLQAAPIFMGNNRLNTIADLFDAARRTDGVIKRNFAISLGYNAVAVCLAIVGWITPLVAAVLMPVSSLTVLGLTLVSPTYRNC